ncbi:MAG: hypothetical protein ABRQ38_18420 [Candidatus Eremiobacterota bacterium]
MKHVIFILMSFILFMCLFCSGCSDDIVYTTPVLTPAPQNIYPTSDQVLDQYFTAAQVEKMRNDAKPITGSYGGINVFSTAQYGRRFITGTGHVKDIFDARNPVNYEIFRKYAWDNFHVEKAYYERYAEAANKFIAEFEYDAVLFHPDELHPVFTNQSDTWMLLRDAPTNTYDIYYSNRMLDRRIAISGGMKMRALTQNDPLGISDWMYYVPADGTDYVAYTGGSIPAAELTASSTGTSNYVPQDPSPEAIAKRSQYGIIPCDKLSNRDIKIGGWKNENYADDMVKYGMSFTNNPNSSTWGGWGLYVVVLDKEYWE